ncbi:alpha-amylase family glycosyl hydrolase [Streptomyces sp. NPDC002698]|uniref:alpha-amylase family glycosyl hydrolase n=1 Tax=Streptomyces sp. NPDC002698 TaxID=3364660 RepID=UPI00368244A7
MRCAVHVTAVRQAIAANAVTAAQAVCSCPSAGTVPAGTTRTAVSGRTTSVPARVARAPNRRTQIAPATPTTNAASPARGCRWIRVLSSVAAAAAAQGSTPQADWLDHASPAVAGHVVEVLGHWLDRGVAGWRLDAAYAVPPDGVPVRSVATPAQVEALAAEWWR